MSLVERALKKLQQSSAQPPLPVPHSKPAVAAEVVEVRDVAAAMRPVKEAPASEPVQRIERPTRIVKIDRDVLRSMHLLPTPAMERRIASQYQQIKRPLIAAALGKSDPPIPDAQLIMLASALSGDGKTFTSINLALSMARERDMEVVLVDADVAKPHLGHLFGLQNEAGLLDLLTDPSLHPESVILPTDIASLSILPSGRKVDGATELIASERMRELMQQMAGYNRRRIVLLDSPPLLLSTEAQALIPSVGQIVLIVRAEVTPQSAVLAAIEATGGSKPISLILNQSSEAPGTDYYGYGSYGDASLLQAPQAQAEKLQ
jgi:exopolysaccharide/PEP-CTERM locus tyrosine autokinase